MVGDPIRLCLNLCGAIGFRTAYIACVGLLAVLGILEPILKVLWNLVHGIFQVTNGICRNLLWPPFHWLLVLCIRIATAIKRVLELIVRVSIRSLLVILNTFARFLLFQIFFEPLWRYVLRPTLKFCKKRYDFCLVIVGLLLIFAALLDDPEATLLSGSTAIKPLSRFEGRYAQLFGLDPAEGSVAQMETAGTLEVISGFGLIGIALRLTKLALSEKFSAPSNFWKYVPLVRAGAASRLGVSLVKVGVSGLIPLHIGCFTALGVGVLMCARTLSIIGGYIGNRRMSLCLNYTWRYVLALQFEAYSILFCSAAAAASPDPM